VRSSIDSLGYACSPSDRLGPLAWWLIAGNEQYPKRENDRDGEVKMKADLPTTTLLRHFTKKYIFSWLRNNLKHHATLLTICLIYR
jgi:hypothetical protein